MIRRSRCRNASAPFDHGEPIKGFKTLPFAILATACVAFFIPFQRIPTHAVVVDLPMRSDQMPAWERTPSINRVTIDAESYLKWNGRQISGAELATLLHKSKKVSPEPYLLFAPNGGASYDSAAKVLNIIIASGITKFCFVELENYRNFGKDNSGLNPAITTPLAVKTLDPNRTEFRLTTSLIFDEDYQTPSEPVPRPDRLTTECEALAQLP